TRYVLCTFDMVSTPYTRTDMLHYLRLIMRAGYKPILTRAESYIHQKQDLSFLEKLHNEGVGLQVNSSSLLGGQGEQIRTLAYNLLSSGMIHIIATDTHSYEGFSVPNMKDTFQYLSKSFDYKALKRLMYDNPLHIISNESLETIEARKKGLFERIKMRY
ncbi:MAG: CpsB/CapC family capsule biosynthesis tyrosine phosphatase, partial [bacterium]